jgi:hypothetical protein
MGITIAGAASSVYLLPGMSVKLKAKHFFIKTIAVEHMYQDGSSELITPINGFVVDNDTVGDIEAVPEEPAVIYRHKKFELNAITFYALTGEKGRVNIMSVPIHDHSSIVAGGPAYGTFFSDDETVSNITEE